jgi:periplasmic divalent cation tolerance protein
MIIILTTYSDEKRAEKAAEDLLEEELAACVNILPISKSVYRWKGKIEKEKEFLLLIKTKERAYRRIEKYLKENHPYDTPEILFLKIDGGNKDYLKWADDSILSRLLSVPLDFRLRRRADLPSREDKRARKPRTSLR